MALKKREIYKYIYREREMGGGGERERGGELEKMR